MPTDEERRKAQLRRIREEKKAAKKGSDEEKDSLIMQGLKKIADLLPGKGEPGLMHDAAKKAREREKRRREILGMED